jgi:hypothetical protein
MTVSAGRITELLEIEQVRQRLNRRPTTPHCWTRFQLNGSQIQL